MVKFIKNLPLLHFKTLLFVLLYAYSCTKEGMDMYVNVHTMSMIRYSVAFVFIISGTMKIVSNEVANHFLSLGLPSAHTLLYVVALLEIGCGICIVANKWVKYSSIPLIIIICGAILLTKIPLLHTDVLTFLFQVRLDFVMLLLLIVLFLKN